MRRVLPRVVVVALALGGLAWSPPPAVAAPVVSGVVTDAASGQPLAGVTVIHQRSETVCLPFDPMLPPICIPLPVSAGTTTTDASGRYALDDPTFTSAGPHTMTFSDPLGQYAGASLATVGSGTLDAQLALVAEAPTITATAAPAVTGSPRVGQTLSASAGGWSVAPSVLRYAWAAGGAPVGSGPSYVVRAADAGKALTVTVTAWTRGARAGTSTSAPTAAVQSTASTLTVTPRHRRGTRVVRLAIGVVVPGHLPAGEVRVYRGRKLVRTVRLTAGRAAVRLAKQPTGRQRYRVVYAGEPGVLGATKTVRVRV